MDCDPLYVHYVQIFWIEFMSRYWRQMAFYVISS